MFIEWMIILFIYKCAIQIYSYNEFIDACFNCGDWFVNFEKFQLLVSLQWLFWIALINYWESHKNNWRVRRVSGKSPVRITRNLFFLPFWVLTLQLLLLRSYWCINHALGVGITIRFLKYIILLFYLYIMI